MAREKRKKKKRNKLMNVKGEKMMDHESITFISCVFDDYVEMWQPKWSPSLFVMWC